MNWQKMLSLKNCFFVLWLSSVAVMAAVFYFEFVMKLAPCKLCYYERIPFYFMIGLGCIGFLLRGRPKLLRALIVLAGIGFIIGAGISGYHTGVEQKWWQGPTACSGVGLNATSVEQLKAMILSAPMARCDEIPWSLFGISMAGFSFLISFGLAFYALISTFVAPSRQERFAQ